MIFISEWLPNPAGSDTEGEWLELVNQGLKPVDLRGWRIETPSGKKFILRDHRLEAGGYLLLKRSETKLSLRNEDGALALFNPEGELADQTAFLGSAPEGKSFARLGKEFLFVEPTPGSPNEAVLATAVLQRAYPEGLLAAPPAAADFIPLILGSAAVVTALTVFISKRHEILSKLIFSRDEGLRD